MTAEVSTIRGQTALVVEQVAVIGAATRLGPPPSGVPGYLPDPGSALRGRRLVAMLHPAEPLPHGHGHGAGEAFTRHGGKLPGQALGLIILDVETHGGILLY